MINLAQNSRRDLNAISVDFYRQLEWKIKSKLNTHSRFLNTFSTKSGHKLAVYLRAHLRKIIMADLQTIIDNHEPELETVFKNNYVTINKVHSDFRKKIDEIFNYESFSSSSGYSFTKTLDIDVCPYCNRNYITTLGNSKSKFVRSDIDHFMPKYKYPYLRLSFYNLIPSCVICNRNAKGKKHTSISKNIHPYVEGFGDDAKFVHRPRTYKDLIGKGNPKIDFSYSKNKAKVKRVKKNIEIFRLKEQYSIHSNELNHLLALKEAFTESYIDDLIKRYPKLKLTKDEAYYYLFGVKYSDVEDEVKPLSKLTRDILDHIDMITI